MKPIVQLDFLPSPAGDDFLVNLGKIEKLDPSSFSPVLHTKAYFEIFLLTQGTGNLYLDDQIIEIKAGMLISCLPWQVRKWQIEEAIQGYTFYFDEQFLNDYLEDEIFLNRFAIFDYCRPAMAISLKAGDYEKCCWVLQELEEEFLELKEKNKHIFRALLFYSISLMDRIYRKDQELSRMDSHPIIIRFKNLLNQHINCWHTVLEYAKALNISRNHLNNLCSEYLFHTANQIINQRLIVEAKRKVQFSGQDLEDIADSLNFPNLEDFNQFFRRMTTQTLLDFRSRLA